jgi:hypothetical protein
MSSKKDYKIWCPFLSRPVDSLTKCFRSGIRATKQGRSGSASEIWYFFLSGFKLITNACPPSLHRNKHDSDSRDELVILIEELKRFS